MVVCDRKTETDLRRTSKNVFTLIKIPRLSTTSQEGSPSNQRTGGRLSSLGTDIKGYVENTCLIFFFCYGKHRDNASLFNQCSARKI
jgi:hypothetical protein